MPSAPHSPPSRSSRSSRASIARVAALALLAGCLPDDPREGVGCGQTLDDPLALIEVQSAHLEDLALWQAGLVAGRTEGTALLVVADTNGDTHEFPAILEGSHGGLVVDASVLATFDAEFPLVLPIGGVNARQLLGRYEGTHVGADVVVGFHYRDLANADAVRLNVSSLSFGVGFVPLTWEALGLQLVDDPAELVGDPCAFGACACANDGLCEDVCDFDPDCPEDDCSGDGFCDDLCDVDDDCDTPPDGLGDACAFAGPGDAGSCSDGLVCVRAHADALEGRCRLPCDATDGAACAALPSHACVDVTTAPRGAVEATACVPRGLERDATCASIAQPEAACNAGSACMPAGLADVVAAAAADAGEGAQYLEQRCRAPCASDDDCAGVDACVTDGLGNALCGTSVAPLPLEVAAELVAGGALPEELTCNDTAASRVCDQGVFRGAEGAPGLSACLALADSGDGVCFPLCAVPAVDSDGDAVLGDDERGLALACGAGFACTHDLSRALGLFAFVPAPEDPQRARPCDPAACPPGAPCEACGPGDATCADVDGAPLCVALFGACAPE